MPFSRLPFAVWSNGWIAPKPLQRQCLCGPQTFPQPFESAVFANGPGSMFMRLVAVCGNHALRACSRLNGRMRLLVERPQIRPISPTCYPFITEGDSHAC